MGKAQVVMDTQSYVAAAVRTDLSPEQYGDMLARLSEHRVLRLLHALMGITTEAGELMDALKKYLLYGKPLDVPNLFEESGDSMWYHALLHDAYALPMTDTMRRNIDKLRARYPEKFTTERALNRDLTVERQTLEE